MKKLVVVLFFFTALFQTNVFAQETSKKVMVVYGSDQCHHCLDTKEYLKKNNIDFGVRVYIYLYV